MKRKAISQLLHVEDPADVLAKLVPADGRTEPTARKVLAAVLMRSRRDGVADPEQFYARVCESSAAALSDFLVGTPVEALSVNTIARSQTRLRDALTSRAGRPKESALSRKEQLATAQQQRRDKQRQEEGKVLLHVFISQLAMTYLIDVQAALGCDSRADALESVLQAAREGQVVQLAVTRSPRRRKSGS